MNHLIPSTCNTFLSQGTSTCNTSLSQEPPAPSIVSLEPTTLDILFKCDANATLAKEPP